MNAGLLHLAPTPFHIGHDAMHRDAPAIPRFGVGYFSTDRGPLRVQVWHTAADGSGQRLVMDADEAVRIGREMLDAGLHAAGEVA